MTKRHLILSAIAASVLILLIFIINDLNANGIDRIMAYNYAPSETHTIDQPPNDETIDYLQEIHCSYGRAIKTRIVNTEFYQGIETEPPGQPEEGYNFPDGGFANIDVGFLTIPASKTNHYRVTMIKTSKVDIIEVKQYKSGKYQKTTYVQSVDPCAVITWDLKEVR